jgi:signal transduction histidine kinase
MRVSMAVSEKLTRLAEHRSLGHAPPEEHAWLAAHGHLRLFDPGDVVAPKGELVTELYILFSGSIAIHVDRGAGSHKLFEWKGGDVSGTLPFSRGARPPNDTVAEEPTVMLTVSNAHFAELIRECPVSTATMVHLMLDRARQFKEGDLHDEKLLSLGRLAAGLAHELNNPAAAAVRSASLLAASIAAAESAAAAVAGAGLSAAQLAAIESVRVLCAAPAPTRSPMERADREEAFTDWLADHHASEDCAGPLSETGVTLEALDTLATSVGDEVLDASLRWIAAGGSLRALGSEIGVAAARIRDLVNGVKGFTYMDRAPTPEPVDIRSGIADTLTVLGAKVREKSAVVAFEPAADLPRAHAVGAELNQVWMNLIDNALDAVHAGGHVTVTAAKERDRVLVRVTDDGPGVPPELKDRIFDPFFTTKGVGKGTGLGLDIVRRILRRHEGEISMESRPGHTEFRVSLPAER